MERVEIPLSKTKIVLLFIGSLLFVIFGTLGALNPERFLSTLYRNPEIIRFSAIAGVIFFGATGIYSIIKFFDKKMGLIIDENGIFDNSNASSVGLIKWCDIIEIKTKEVASTKFLLIYTRNPGYYLDKTKGFKRKLLQANNSFYGTPLSITSSGLAYNFNKLESLLNNSLIEQKK